MNAREKINRAHAAMSTIICAYNEVKDLAEGMGLLDKYGDTIGDNNLVCIAKEHLGWAVHRLQDFVEEEMENLVPEKEEK
jgi:hypothetical protein